MKRILIRLKACIVCLAVAMTLAFIAPQRAFADLEIGKVLATTSYSPVALMDVTQITAATSTSGCYIISYNWYDSSGQPLSGSFGTENYRVEIQLGAADGYYFSENLAVYLNNSSVDFNLDPTLKALTLYRVYAPELWTPSVIKSPGSEKVEIGGWASFVATATYVSSYKWTLTSPDGKTSYSCEELPDKFPGVTTDADGTTKMNIYNIPLEMDGWKIRCIFKGAGGDAYSSYATISVKHDEPTPAPTQSAAPTPSPTPDKAAEKEEGDHVHEYSDRWSYDGQTHWRECSCGEKSGQEVHRMEWTEVTPASKKIPGAERGVCSVCGYSETRELEYAPTAAGSSGVLRYILWGLGALALLTVIVLIADSAKRRRRRRRRRYRR